MKALTLAAVIALSATGAAALDTNEILTKGIKITEFNTEYDGRDAIDAKDVGNVVAAKAWLLNNPDKVKSFDEQFGAGSASAVYNGTYQPPTPQPSLLEKEMLYLYKGLVYYCFVSMPPDRIEIALRCNVQTPKGLIN